MPVAQDVLGAGGQRSVAFRCRGHANVRASHLKSLEFTRADEITPRATCVLGVAADFDPALLRGLRGSLRVTIEAGGRGDVVRALANPGFGAGDRIVIRTTRHRSPETLATEADRGASRIDRDLVAALAGGGPVRVTISEEPAPLIGREATGLEGLAVAVEAGGGPPRDRPPLPPAARAPAQPPAASRP